MNSSQIDIYDGFGKINRTYSNFVSNNFDSYITLSNYKPINFNLLNALAHELGHDILEKNSVGENKIELIIHETFAEISRIIVSEYLINNTNNFLEIYKNTNTESFQKILKKQEQYKQNSMIYMNGYVLYNTEKFLYELVKDRKNNKLSNEEIIENVSIKYIELISELLDCNELKKVNKYTWINSIHLHTKNYILVYSISEFLAISIIEKLNSFENKKEKEKYLNILFDIVKNSRGISLKDLISQLKIKF